MALLREKIGSPDKPLVVAMLGTMVIGLVLLPVSSCSPSEDGLNLQKVQADFPAATRLRPTTPSNEQVQLWVVEGLSGVVGYVGQTECQARSGTFMLTAAVDEGLIVRSVRISRYNAVQGHQVQSPRFSEQFKAKGPDDPLRLGEDIDAVSGATISSRAACDGVRRILLAVQQIRLGY